MPWHFDMFDWLKRWFRSDEISVDEAIEILNQQMPFDRARTVKKLAPLLPRKITVDELIRILDTLLDWDKKNVIILLSPRLKRPLPKGGISKIQSQAPPFDRQDILNALLKDNR